MVHNLGVIVDGRTSNSRKHFCFVTCRFNGFKRMGKLHLPASNFILVIGSIALSWGIILLAMYLSLQKARLEMVELKKDKQTLR